MQLSVFRYPDESGLNVAISISRFDLAAAGITDKRIDELVNDTKILRTPLEMLGIVVEWARRADAWSRIEYTDELAGKGRNSDEC